MRPVKLKIITALLACLLVVMVVLAPAAVSTIVGGPLLVAVILMTKACIGLSVMATQAENHQGADTLT
ncbi:Uncharacterised protein [BD1-7 clade bacterium]|uniref:Uncharacterized protein n=1 Tax=BD1-7 clade bacterium TaxID=2029982 RepID=A0A5S9MRS5_9GAMM|nr:Uncharacterised protein [BD1-7 clade bacterium]